VLQATRHLERARRQAGLGRGVGDAVGQQVQRAERRAALRARSPSTATPTAASMLVRRIRGRPTSAVGSLLSTASTSAIPSCSILADPAQS
jgi:hypothetical protein